MKTKYEELNKAFDGITKFVSEAVHERLYENRLVSLEEANGPLSVEEKGYLADGTAGEAEYLGDLAARTAYEAGITEVDGHFTNAFIQDYLEWAHIIEATVDHVMATYKDEISMDLLEVTGHLPDFEEGTDV